MDKKELLDVASDLFRVVELQIIEMEKLRSKIAELQDKLKVRPTMRAADETGTCPFCELPWSEHFAECPKSY